MIASLILQAFVGAHCLRPEIAHSVLRTESGTQVIAGVPVVNYHRLFEGKSSVVEADPIRFLVVPEDGVTQKNVTDFCQTQTTWSCVYVGHCTEGVEFFEITCNEGCTNEVAVQESLGIFLNDARGKLTIRYTEVDTLTSTSPEFSGTASQAPTWGLKQIKTERRKSTGRGVHVFIMDSGVRSTHEEFDGRVIPTMDFTSRPGDLPENCLESNDPTTCATDNEGGGTHVAGTIAARNYGVAPEATLHVLKVVNNYVGKVSWMEEALDYVSYVVSLGVQRPAVLWLGLQVNGYSQAIRDAIDECVSRGVVAFTEAGYEDPPRDASSIQPANMPSVITVGSTGMWDENNVTIPDHVSEFSNYGPSVNIWAPGFDTYSTDYWSDTQIWYWDGTAQAAAHAVGVAALIREMKPQNNVSQIREEMMSAALPGVIIGLSHDDVNLLLQVPGQGLGSSRPDA